MKIQILLAGVAFAALTTEADSSRIDKIRAYTDKRIAAIRATPDLVPTEGAPVYYLSEKGDDGADGRTPATAWKTTDRLGEEKGKIAPGSFVLFERGGLFRGGFRAEPGVTYAAYGKGPKPRIYSSPENGADPSKWEKTDAKNVWRYKIGNKDVGTMVFNEGEAHAIKILPIYNQDGTFTQQYGKRPFKRPTSSRSPRERAMCTSTPSGIPDRASSRSSST